MSASAQSRRAWGWHRLTDDWAARVVADAGVRPGALVLDLGAGNGALTAHLVEAGARVIAVELHPARARRLRERFHGAPVTVVEADALEVRLPARPFRVVASPPYTVSRGLVRRLLARRSALVAADLVLQRAVVRHFAESYGPPDPRTGSAGRPAGPRAGRWSVRAGRPLPRRAFRPAPRVDSAVLVVRRRR